MSEAASVEAAMQRWSGKATFVGVAWSGTEQDYREFIALHGLTFPQISDSNGEVFARFSVSSQPALAIVSSSGEVSQLYGAADATILDTLINKAINA